jgi:dolichyl-phosphate-mannose-protein mannosyltransferase
VRFQSIIQNNPDSANKYFLFIIYSLTLISLIFGIYCRWQNLDLPNSMSFDEAIFVKDARKIVANLNYYNDHPPLGKMIIGSGIKLFGDNTFGWRFFSAIFGTFLIFLSALLVHALFKNRLATLFSICFTSLDGSLIAYSRLALLDIYHLFFAVCAIFLILRDKESKYTTIFSVAISIACAGAVKYNGVWAIVPIFFILYSRRDLFKFLILILSSLITYFCIICLHILLLGQRPVLDHAFAWQKESISFHTSVKTPHIYSSKWYTWPLVIKPVRVAAMADVPDRKGYVFSIISITNPVLSILGVYLILYSFILFIKKNINIRAELNLPNKKFLFLVLCYFCAFIPWAFISRPAFQYHYIPAYLILIFICAYYLSIINQKHNLKVVTILCIWIISVIVFLPLSSAIPLTRSDYNKRLLSDCWKDPCPRI